VKTVDAKDRRRSSLAADNAWCVGDSDFINDGGGADPEIFGQRIVIPRNGNIASRRRWSTSSRATPTSSACAAGERGAALQPIRDMERGPSRRISARSRN